MLLLEDAMEECAIMDRITKPDGQGGFVSEWTEGAHIYAVINLDNSTQARIGEKLGVANLYTIITPGVIVLEYHDVLRRLSDSKVFRITSDGSDSHTPKSATLDLRMVSAEEWELAK